MTSSRKEDERVMEILAAARQKPAGDREAYLQSACAGDEDLCREVVDALSWEERMGGFLQQPVAMIADGNPDSGVTAAVQFAAGLEIRQYRIESKLGEGGMSTVWLALDTRLRRRVAIKFLSDDLADAEARRRFQREAQMASSLNHPHIVTVYDTGEYEGRQYLVTEYVDGGTLKDWVKDKRRTPKEVAEVLTGVADGLAAAHQAGILHRDIKPMNILVARNGYAKLADFGLAKLAEDGTIDLAARLPEGPTRPGLILGTIAYMSPEQASGQPLDSRSDIFSFGVVLYEMFSGRRPFGGRTDLEVLKTIIHGALPPLSEEVPEAYRNVVEKALEKSPAERYQSMREMVVDLRRGQRSQRLPAPGVEEAIAPVEGGVASPGKLSLRPSSPPLSARRDSGETQSRKQNGWSHGREWNWLVSGAVLVVVLAAAIWYLHRPLPPPRISRYSQITHDGHGKYIAGTDGSRLYFNFMSSQSLAQVAISGGETASIPVAVPGASHSLLRVSPDGSSFLIRSVEEGNYALGRSLWNVRILGGSYRRLGHGLGGTFSPDGNSVAYTNEGDLWIVRSDGTGAHKIASVGDKAYDLVWSPDGGTIRFTREDRFWEINSSGSSLHPFLPNWRVSAAQCCGRWTPDGKFFIFISTESPSQSSEIWAIDGRRGLLRRPPTDPIQLTNGPMRWDSLIPGRDGKEVFAVGKTPRGELARYDLKTKQLQPFLGGISADSVSFSEDGQYVAYVTYPEGVLWRANRDGSNPVQLSDPPMHPSLPRWSHDGAQILFDDFSSSSPKAYIVSALGGAAPRRLLPEDHGAEYDPNWSPDGHKIVFESGAMTDSLVINRKRDHLALDRKGDSLSIFDTTTGQVEKVAGSTGTYSPRWSPDGRYIFALNYNWSTKCFALFDIQTQHWAALPSQRISVGYPEWSPDSQFIYFVHFTGDDQGVFRVRAKDGAAERVVDLRNVHVIGMLGFWFGLDPTGSPLVLRDFGGDDIYALTLEEK